MSSRGGSFDGSRSDSDADHPEERPGLGHPMTGTDEGSVEDLYSEDADSAMGQHRALPEGLYHHLGATDDVNDDDDDGEEEEEEEDQEEGVFGESHDDEDHDSDRKSGSSIEDVSQPVDSQPPSDAEEEYDEDQEIDERSEYSESSSIQEVRSSSQQSSRQGEPEPAAYSWQGSQSSSRQSRTRPRSAGFSDLEEQEEGEEEELEGDSDEDDDQSSISEPSQQDSLSYSRRQSMPAAKRPRLSLSASRVASETYRLDSTSEEEDEEEGEEEEGPRQPTGGQPFVRQTPADAQRTQGSNPTLELSKSSRAGAGVNSSSSSANYSGLLDVSSEILAVAGQKNRSLLLAHELKQQLATVTLEKQQAIIVLENKVRGLEHDLLKSRSDTQELERSYTATQQELVACKAQREAEKAEYQAERRLWQREERTLVAKLETVSADSEKSKAASRKLQLQVQQLQQQISILSSSVSGKQSGPTASSARVLSSSYDQALSLIPEDENVSALSFVGPEHSHESSSVFDLPPSAVSSANSHSQQNLSNSQRLLDASNARIHALENELNVLKRLKSADQSAEAQLQQRVKDLEKQVQSQAVWKSEYEQMATQAASSRLLQEQLEETKMIVANLQFENKKLQQDLSSANQRADGVELWTIVFPGERPSQVRAKLEELLAENSLLRKQHESDLQRVQMLQDAIRTFEQEKEVLQREIDQTREHARSVDLSHDEFRVRTSLAERETTSLKDLLHSVVGSSSEMEDLRSRLDTIVAEKDSEIARLRKELDVLHSSSVEDKKLLHAAQGRANQLHKENEMLGIQLSDLVAKVNKKDYDPSTTKVLHLTINPSTKKKAQQAADEVQKLSAELTLVREENRTLKSRLDALESAGSASVVVDASVDVGKLQDEIQDLKKLNQRIKEMFRVKAKEFREAVYLLFGWRVDLASEQVYRLQSMYAETESDILLFRFADGAMHLLESDFVKRIGDDLMQFLHRVGSIPVFLSQLTESVYERHTMA